MQAIQAQVGNFGLGGAAVSTIRGRVDALTAALGTAPKTAKWRMPARVGERVRWYQEPEEARA